MERSSHSGLLLPSSSFGSWTYFEMTRWQWLWVFYLTLLGDCSGSIRLLWTLFGGPSFFQTSWQVDYHQVAGDCRLSQIWHKSCSERCGSWRRHCNHRNSLDRWHDWTLSTVFLCLLCGRQYRRFRAAFCSMRPQRLLQDIVVKLLNEGPTIYSA